MLNLALKNDGKSATLSCKYHNKTASICVTKYGLELEESSLHRFHDYSVLEKMVNLVLADWEPPKNGKLAKINGGKVVSKEDMQKKVIHKWKSKTLVPKWTKFLSKEFHKIWQTLLQNADQKMVNLDKGLYRAYGPKGSHSVFTSLYEKIKDIPYAIEDVTKYIPACLFYINDHFYDRENRGGDDDWIPGRNIKLSEVGDWKQFYSVDGRTYSQLNKTLMLIKYPVRFDILGKLRRIKLERPILSRTELYSILAVNARFRPIVWKSSKKDILDAVKYFNKLNNRKILCRKYDAFHDFWQQMNDYPDPYNGTLKGLVKRSFDWHRVENQARMVARTKKAGYTPETLTAIPPIDLTKLDKSVKLIKNVGELHDEGAQMGHCVASYASSAVKGYSYIFSISREGERATVELCSNPWQINQSRGPHNQANKASKWAEKYFYNFIKKEKLNDELTTAT